MTKRTYEGDPLDHSWQDFEDRPFGGEGETVDVVDNTPHNQRGEVELPADFHLSEKYFEIFLALAEIGPAPVRELAESVDMSRRGGWHAVEKLVEVDLAAIEEDVGKYGADLIHPAVSPDDKFVFSNGVTSDLLPSKTHPIRLTPNQRRVLAHATRYPTKSKTKIGEATGISQVNVGRTLREHGDPRREINHLSVGHAQSELELVEERLEHLKERRTELKRQIKSGEGYQDGGAD